MLLFLVICTVLEEKFASCLVTPKEKSCTEQLAVHSAAVAQRCTGRSVGATERNICMLQSAAQPLISQCSCMLPCKGCFRLSSTWCVFEQLDGTWPRDRQAGNEEIACLILDLFFDYLF